MRTLLLLRHAKSSWADVGTRDHERALNARGEATAPRMAELLRDQALIPDLILSSSAVRARRTAEIVAATLGLSEDHLGTSEDLYLASPGTILDVVRGRAGDADKVLVVGHNPGIEDLVEAFVGWSEVMPTAALAAFRLDIDSWHDLAPMSPAELLGLWRPNEIDD